MQLSGTLKRATASSPVELRPNPQEAKQVHQVRHVIDVDDDDDSWEGNGSTVVYEREEEVAELVQLPAQQSSKRKKPRLFPSLASRMIPPSQVLGSLGVVEVSTSGYLNNCLWFSTQVAAGNLSVGGQGSAGVSSMTGRRLIHEELMCALPTSPTHGANDVWWAGMSHTRAQVIYDANRMMVEAHVYAVANMRKQKVMVVDTRMAAVVIRVFHPGYIGFDISLKTACELLACDPHTICIMLQPHHYCALLPVKH